MASMRRFLVVFLIGLALASAAACGGNYIRSENLYAGDPGFQIEEEAEIPDTTANRQVLDVIANYRQAVVRKDFGTLKRLISEEYYDNAGTTDTTQDDYSAEHLIEVFELMANNADEIKFNVLVQDVRVEKDRAFVDYQYDFAYRYKVDDEVGWDAGVEVNRLELIEENGRWRIVSGL